MADAEYVCIKEDKIAELEAKNGFKEQRINELIIDQRRMEEKIDNIAENVNQLMLQSVKDDNNLNQRITAIEARQDTLYRLIAVVSVLLVALDFILKYIIH